MVEVGLRVKAARVRRMLTQTELASVSGVGRATIARIEAGTGHPRMTTIRALAEALDLPARELVPDPESLWGGRTDEQP